MIHKITALVDSKLKKFPIDSSLLSSGQAASFPRGKTYEVAKWEKSEDDHIKVELASGAGTWYFYDPHVHFPPIDDKVAIAPRRSGSKTLSKDDYIQAARMLNCSVAAIKAVVEIEAAGRGFQKDGRPTILFEPHIFGKLTQYRYNRTLPHLSSYRWDRSLYRKGGTSWQKMERAIGLNPYAAMQSASFGSFQIMGFHFKVCGYETPKEYYDAQFISEFEHLRCFIAFVKSKKLDRHLRTLNWKAFAYSYNGELYWKNKYDTKLAAAYRKYSS